MWGWTRVEQLLQDIRYALRMLRKNPGFAIVTIITLALGIGMNTAVFSVVNAVLLKPLPYPNAERLVWLSDYNESFKMEAVAGPDFLDWKQQSQSFEKMAATASDLQPSPSTAMPIRRWPHSSPTTSGRSRVPSRRRAAPSRRANAVW